LIARFFRLLLAHGQPYFELSLLAFPDKALRGDSHAIAIPNGSLDRYITPQEAFSKVVDNGYLGVKYVLIR
jgi:hypothetical protein